jgi:hypothetical protein
VVAICAGQGEVNREQNGGLIPIIFCMK